MEQQDIKSIKEWEKFNLTNNYAAILDALTSLQYVITLGRQGKRMTDAEALEVYKDISSPLFCYRTLLDEITE